MTTRLLPGAYVSLNDLSQFPEGEASLVVGYTLKANRGPVNEATLVTSPTDFLKKFTFSGSPAVNDDPTYWSILKVLQHTNQMYVVRAANNPLYGGAVVKKAKELGTVAAIDTENKAVTLSGSVSVSVGSKVLIGSGYFTVLSTSSQTLTTIYISEGVAELAVGENVAHLLGTVKAVKADETAITMDGTILATEGETLYVGENAFEVVSATQETVSGATITKIVLDSVEGINAEDTVSRKFGEVAGVNSENSSISMVGSQDVNPGDNLLVGTNAVTVSELGKVEVTSTLLAFEESVSDLALGNSVKSMPIVPLSVSIADPESYIFAEDDLMLIAGVNPGAYNGKLAFNIVSAKDNSSDLVYYPGANIAGEAYKYGTMQLQVRNAETNELLETFTFSRNSEAKEIDGTSLFVDNVVKGASSYIQIVNNTAIDADELPFSTATSKSIQAGAGSDGDEVTASTLVGALQAGFASKNIPVSILGNGCSAEAETKLFQQALIEIADKRQDIMVFLNDRKADEKALDSSSRAQAVVDHKKDLGSTSFYGCMYAPHVETADTFHSSTVRIGSEAVAIAGWLRVINNLRFPYAYAGPQNGLVSGVTCDWKIGDESGEATVLNDASINYVAYDGRQGRYYMQCQNTLQVANSAMRNIGVVLNVLDIKEHVSASLKEYINLPITASLRRSIYSAINGYLSPMEGTRFYNYSFQDVTTDGDLAQDTLRYLLIISPTRYANKIYCVMNIVNSTFDFSILQSA